jgi:hypothetical protein
MSNDMVTQFFHTKVTYILYYQITCAQWYMYKWIVENVCDFCVTKLCYNNIIDKW